MDSYINRFERYENKETLINLPIAYLNAKDHLTSEPTSTVFMHNPLSKPYLYKSMTLKTH